MADLDELRSRIRASILADEAETIARLTDEAALSVEERTRIGRRALKLVEKVRAAQSAGMLESFLAEYSLSTHEGIALMCLAEALLRISAEFGRPVALGVTGPGMSWEQAQARIPNARMAVSAAIDQLRAFEEARRR